MKTPKTPTKTISLRVTETEYNALIAFMEHQESIGANRTTLTKLFRSMVNSQLEQIVLNHGVSDAIL